MKTAQEWAKAMEHWFDGIDWNRQPGSMSAREHLVIAIQSDAIVSALTEAAEVVKGLAQSLTEGHISKIARSALEGAEHSILRLRDTKREGEG